MMAGSKTTDEETGVERAVERARDNVKTFAHSAAGAAADGVDHLVDRGADGIKAVAGVAPQVGEWADDKLEAARDRVRAEPIKMMAIAAGVGAVLGAIFLRR